MPEEIEVPHWLLPLMLSPFAGIVIGTLARTALAYTMPIVHPAGVDCSWDEARGRDLVEWNGSPVHTVARWHDQPDTSIGHIWLLLTICACASVVGSMVLADVNATVLWAGCCLGWTLLLLAWIDLEHMLLPDVLTLPLIVAGLGATLLIDPAAVSEHAAAAAAGYIVFRTIEFSYRWLRGQDGLGQGDAKLLAAAGAWLGLTPLPTIVFVAALMGVVMVVGLRVAGRVQHNASMVPFGPSLCAAIWIAWLGYDPLLALMTELPG